MPNLTLKVYITLFQFTFPFVCLGFVLYTISLSAVSTPIRVNHPCQPCNGKNASRQRFGLVGIGIHELELNVHLQTSRRPF